MRQRSGGRRHFMGGTRTMSTDAIELMLELGRRVGVRGVPATVIGDQLVPGALPLEEMVRHIDRALAAKNK
ncbi:MAG TPA: hypothetical protein VN947_34505 [Polyangia bacterium]|nr:hypothetical protein [Polyangia bacterium]